MTPEEKRERQQAANRKWYAKNREKVLGDHRAWRAANPDRMRELNARWYKDNHEHAVAARREWTAKNPAYNRTWRLIRMGCPPEQYQALYATAGGCCMICRKAAKVLHVDHDHATGKIRGLLCGTCNRMLGFAGDSVERIRAAIAYLEHSPSQ